MLLFKFYKKIINDEKSILEKEAKIDAKNRLISIYRTHPKFPKTLHIGSKNTYS